MQFKRMAQLPRKINNFDLEPDISISESARMDQSESVETLQGDCVLIVGGGPVGLILATSLAHFGVRSILLERNLSTTRYFISKCPADYKIIANDFSSWPKMDLTNARSMEIFRRLGKAEELRRKGKIFTYYPS
jgi:FAD-dependent monooxygenase